MERAPGTAVPLRTLLARKSRLAIFQAPRVARRGTEAAAGIHVSELLIASFHQLDVRQLPCPVEQSFLRGVEAKHWIPPSAGDESRTVKPGRFGGSLPRLGERTKGAGQLSFERRDHHSRKLGNPLPPDWEPILAFAGIRSLI